MHIHDHLPSGLRPVEELALQMDVAKRRRASLADYESNLNKVSDEHPWWSFFDCGVIDEEGASWAVYNRWCNENDACGWKVVRCPADQAEYREISVQGVERQDIFRARPGKDGLRAFQLHLYDVEAGFTNHDVLSLGIYHNDTEAKPHLKFWKHGASMRPIPNVITTPELEALSAD